MQSTLLITYVTMLLFSLMVYFISVLNYAEYKVFFVGQSNCDDEDERDQVNNHEFSAILKHGLSDINCNPI